MEDSGFSLKAQKNTNEGNQQAIKAISKSVKRYNDYGEIKTTRKRS
jgi:hypothetical protein